MNRAYYLFNLTRRKFYPSGILRPRILLENPLKKIYQLFQQYKENQDFIGMDMARKFLQVGMTRSLRYYHHKSGKKYLGPVPADKKGQSGSHG